MSRSKRDPEALLRRLEWTVLRWLDGLLQGDYRTLFQGFGLDLADLREYEFGDDVRHIDWNVTARMQRPYVRRYLEDREVTAWFLLDVTRSIDFGTVTVTKRALLAELVGVLARVLARRGNRIGAMLYDGWTIVVIPARPGRLQVVHLLAELMSEPRRGTTQQTDLGLLLGAAFRALRGRSLVIVVSDFLSEPGWQKPLGLLARKHEVIAVRIHDPREIELPDIGCVFFEDAETREQLYLDTHDSAFRRRFAEAAARRKREVEEGLRSAGIDAMELGTEDDLLKAVLRFAARRRLRRATPAAFAHSGSVSISSAQREAVLR